MDIIQSLLVVLSFLVMATDSVMFYLEANAK